MADSIHTIVENVQKKRTSAVEQVKRALAKAEEMKTHNSLLSVSAERALKQARIIDEKIANGDSAGPLAGVTFVAKDNFLTLGGKTTAASKILGNFSAPLQATVVDKLEKAGAICIGKTNLDSFAHGASTENSAYGPTKNAYDTSRVAGGSSGGSAVAVALGIVPFALGSDTGGSIRQPACFNNVVGVKPTYGAVSRFGVIAMTSSIDCIGTLTKTAAEAELVIDIITGADKRDSTSLPDFFKPKDDLPEKMKIGILKEGMGEIVEPEVLSKVNSYITQLKQMGHQANEISIPTLPHSLAMYYIITPAEVSSNLARYDGIRYGELVSRPTLAEQYGKTRDQGFESENIRRILIGSYVLSSGYYDAYYQQAQKARTLLINDFSRVFSDYDVIISPVTPAPAFKLGENVQDPLKMYLADILTVAANLAGIPALSVPAGFSKEGLPIGVQLMGPQKSDATLLALAKSMEDN